MSALQTAQREATTGQPETRTGQALLVACAGPLCTGYAATAAILALVTAMAPGATLSTAGVLRAASLGWLVLHHVPVRISGHELGMLPLLPTALVLALVARSAGNAAQRLDWTTPRSAVAIIAAVGGSHAVFGLLLAFACGGAAPVVAFFGAGVLAAVAATAGTARRCGLVRAALSRADDATRTGVRAGVLAVATLIAIGAVVFAVAVLGSWPRVVASFHGSAPGFGAGLGMWLLCLAYLPNIVIGTLSFAAGPGFTIGAAAVGQWHFHGGRVPAIPALAPLPSVEAHWWVFLMVLPIAAGALAGWRCRGLSGPAARLRAVGVAAVLAGVGWLVLAALAGGALAGGPFDPVTVPAGSLAVAVALFVAVPGAVTVLVAGRVMFVAEIEPEIADEAEAAEADEAEVKAGPEPEPDSA